MKNNFLITNYINKYKEKIKEYKELFDDKSELHGTSMLDEIENIDDWLKNVEECKKGTDKFVPFDQYLLVNKYNDDIIGMIQLRYELKGFLLSYGGNIGYSISPIYRNQGYGKIILEEILKICKEKKFEKVLVTCIDSNIASDKIIISQGGILENIVDKNINGRDCKIKRYWIKIK